MPDKVPKQAVYAIKSVRPQHLLDSKYIVPDNANWSVQSNDRSSSLCQSIMTFMHGYC